MNKNAFTEKSLTPPQTDVEFRSCFYSNEENILSGTGRSSNFRLTAAVLRKRDLKIIEYRHRLNEYFSSYIIILIISEIGLLPDWPTVFVFQ